MCGRIRAEALAVLAPFCPRPTGDQSLVMLHVPNLAFPSLDSEALVVALRGINCDLKRLGLYVEQLYAESCVAGDGYGG